MGTTSKMGIPYPAATDYVTDGATDMQAIADQVDLRSGLVKMIPGAVSSAGSIATNGTVTFSGAVSIEIRNVFTDSFTNYLIDISNLNNGSGTGRNISLRMMNNTTEENGNNYTSTVNLVTSTGFVSNEAAAAQSGFVLMEQANTQGAMGAAQIRLFQPKVSVRTSGFWDAASYQAGSANSYVTRRGGIYHTLANAYDGFKIYGVTDNISGTIRVYGYN